jgi:uncharacterized protein
VTRLLLFGLIGLGTQLIDGALGMAYGVTTTSLLLASGVAPAVASASVHLAELGTTAASGFSHWRLGNVDWKTTLPLVVPGAIGGFLGGVALSSVSAESAEPVMAAVLCVLGIYVLLRFSVLSAPPALRRGGKPISRWLLSPLGLFGGFMDAAGGGGWGPVCTPALLSTGRLEPRKVIGSVDTSEWFVALGGSLGFLVALGSEKLDWTVIGGLMAGGVIAAPIAAYIVRYLPPRVLGAAVGGLIVFTNVDTLTASAGITGAGRTVAYVAVALVWAATVAYAVGKVRDDAEQSGPAEHEPDRRAGRPATSTT